MQTPCPSPRFTEGKSSTEFSTTSPDNFYEYWNLCFKFALLSKLSFSFHWEDQGNTTLIFLVPVMMGFPHLLFFPFYSPNMELDLFSKNNPFTQIFKSHSLWLFYNKTLPVILSCSRIFSSSSLYPMCWTRYGCLFWKAKEKGFQMKSKWKGPP